MTDESTGTTLPVGQRLEERVSHFVSTAQKLISEQPETSEYVEAPLSDLQTKWSTLHMHVGETRHLIDLSIEYFTLIDEVILLRLMEVYSNCLDYFGVMFTP